MEMLVYLTILSVLLVIIIASILPLTRSYSRLQVARDITDVGEISMESMVRTIRKSKQIDEINSELGVSLGKLTMESESDLYSFFIEDGALIMEENGESIFLTGNSVSADFLIFRYKETPYSGIIKIEMQLSKEKGEINMSKRFNTGVLIRGKY